jgi:GT2 family glycosyltransferase/glycosyltransferase involved in cell wall biosynthesis
MPLDSIFVNFRKALKLLRRDGLLALVKTISTKLVLPLNWVWGNVLQKINVETQNDRGISRHNLVLFSGVPYDDVGGGQRPAQLTRAALRTGMQVLYIYVYPKYDFTKQRNVVSKVRTRNLVHKNIKYFSTQEFDRFIRHNTRVIFEFPHPAFLEYLDLARARGIHTTFELIDDWSTSLGGDWFDGDVFQKFVENSDIVTGTARLLVNKLIEMGRKDAIYLPNAANEYIFNHTNPYERPSDLPGDPVALYYGSLYGEWFGWEYIREAADKNPDLNICLVGSKPVEIPIILPMNVHFLGEKKIEKLPAYTHYAELCLLPFKTGKLTDAVSPIKVFEYLFMGKPVIATNMVEVKDYPGVSTAKNESEFAELCGRLKNNRSELNRSKVDVAEFVSQNSWFSRLQNITDIKGWGNVSAIILIHNNRGIIGRCLKSLLENCSSYLADVVVVDNASDDGGADYVSENFPQVRLVRNPVNGCSSGRNLGVRHSAGKYLAFFDSDQWFTGCFCFEEALNILEEHAEIGAVGWGAGWLDIKDGILHGSIADYYPRRGLNARASIKGFRTDVAYLGSDGLFIPRTIFEATGGFDVAYDPTSFEDTDLSFEIKKMGFEIAYRDLTCIRHEAHQTTKALENPPEYQTLYSRNASYLMKKWQDYRHFFVKYSW